MSCIKCKFKGKSRYEDYRPVEVYCNKHNVYFSKESECEFYDIKEKPLKLEKAIRKAKKNMDKIKDVDKYLDSIR